MKEGIHPEYGPCVVSCSCGNSFKTRSTVPEIKLAICGACHPFYTGTQKLVDTQGRVDRFNKRYGISGGAEAVGKGATKAVGAGKSSTAGAA